MHRAAGANTAARNSLTSECTFMLMLSSRQAALHHGEIIHSTRASCPSQSVRLLGIYRFACIKAGDSGRAGVQMSDATIRSSILVDGNETKRDTDLVQDVCFVPSDICNTTYKH